MHRMSEADPIAPVFIWQNVWRTTVEIARVRLWCGEYDHGHEPWRRQFAQENYQHDTNLPFSEISQHVTDHITGSSHHDCNEWKRARNDGQNEEQNETKVLRPLVADPNTQATLLDWTYISFCFGNFMPIWFLERSFDQPTRKLKLPCVNVNTYVRDAKIDRSLSLCLPAFNRSSLAHLSRSSRSLSPFT